MKKKISFIAIVLLLFCGTVTASSLNGDFEGNPIVIVKSNGNELTVEDTPAVIYNNRTMVPIYLLKQLGANVQWDQNTYSVDVTIPAVEQLKLLSRVDNEFSKLEAYGNMITTLNDGYSLVINATNASDQLNIYNSTNALLNKDSDTYYDIENEIYNLEREMLNIGIDEKGMEQVRDTYFNAMQYYKLADIALKSFLQSKSASDANTYLTNVKLGLDTASTGKSMAINKYNEYFNKIQSYK